MNLNFIFILASLTLISGIISLIDIIWWKKARKANEKYPLVVEYSRSFFPVFLLVLFIRSFLGQIYHVPTGSLEPTIMPGDFVLVTQYNYGLRLPVLENKFLSVSEPQRGDIAVFHWPVNPHFDFIKRVLGLPGDKVSFINNVFYINGKEVKQTFVNYSMDAEPNKTRTWPVKIMQEDLMGIEHKIYLCAEVASCPSPPPQNFYNLTIPPGEYLMIGDNRDNSEDSRMWGFVPEADFVGKAQFVLINIPDIKRIGNRL